MVFVLQWVQRAIALSHPGRMTHVCINIKLNSIDSDNGLSPGRRQVIIWTNAGLLSIGPLETNFREIRIKIQKFSFIKMHLNVSSAKRRPFCKGGYDLTYFDHSSHIRPLHPDNLYGRCRPSDSLCKCHGLCSWTRHPRILDGNKKIINWRTPFWRFIYWENMKIYLQHEQHWYGAGC